MLKVKTNSRAETSVDVSTTPMDMRRKEVMARTANVDEISLEAQLQQWRSQTLHMVDPPLSISSASSKHN